jgi:hypothetical protein
VVGVKVREENVAQRERHVVAHHLPLRPLAAIEEQRLPLAHERERCDVTLDGGPRRGSPEQADGERHGEKGSLVANTVTKITIDCGLRTADSNLHCS